MASEACSQALSRAQALHGHQWPSEVISGHQWPSVALTSRWKATFFRSARGR